MIRERDASRVTTRRRAPVLAIAFAAFLVVFFAGLAAPRSAHADLPASCSELGLTLTEHSCFHATYGPYQTVTAAAGIVAADVAPKIDAVHTFYDVVLPSPAADNTVSYRIASSGRRGTWAIFHDARVPIRVLSDAGQSLPIVLSHDVPSCPFLPRVDVFELDDVRYRIVLGPASVTRSVLVVENVSDFMHANGRDADGDGYGDAADAIVTACVPAAGYVQNASDCDDADPAIHPAATEICDGVDQNCNGVADDIGLPCTAGLGQCRASGTTQCKSSQAKAVCSAVPLGPRPEACDGVDDDCDGVSDLAEGSLCASDPDQPRCVLVLGTTRCGCDGDEDCGGPTSGRVCDLDTRRCQNGCVALPGRNGCPADLVCTSSDPSKAGRCVAPGSECDGSCEPESDAGVPGPLPGGDGCSCRSAPSSRGDAGLVLLIVAPLAIVARRRRGAVLLALVFGLSKCGGKLEGVGEGTGAREPQADAASDASDDGARCTPELGGKLIAHACSHAKNGPFDTVVASEGGENAPDVSLIHHTYDVVMPSEVAPFRGVVSYTPIRDGRHVFFTDPAVDIVVRAGSAAAPISHREAISKTYCSALASASVVTLEKGKPVQIDLAGAPAREVRFFSEHLATFAEAAWAKECP